MGDIKIDSDFGPLSFYWGAQHPSMGSIKRITDFYRAGEGDLLFFRVERNQVVIHHVSIGRLSTADPNEKLLLMVGSSPQESNVLSAVASALGLIDVGHAVSVSEIKNRLEKKGDPDLVAMLPSSMEKEVGLLELIKKGESQNLEFKGSLSTPLPSPDDHPDRPPVNRKDLNLEVLRTIAAFSNSEGGTLLIGVADDGTPLGLESDLKIHKNKDHFELYLVDLIKESCNMSIVMNCKISFEFLNQKEICRVDVSPSSEEVFVNFNDKKDIFYVRVSNSTRILTSKELLNYVRGRLDAARERPQD
jgi:hypothetical protein